MRPYHAKENSRRKNDVVSKCKTKLTGLVLPGIMNVDTIIPEINTNMTYDYQDKFAYFRQALICGIITQHVCYISQ